MLSYLPLSAENIEEAINLVCSIFPDDCKSQDSPAEAYKASLDKKNHEDFIQRHHLDIIEYFVVKNNPSEKIIGVTGWYTQNVDTKDVIWLGWYCLHPAERGNGFGKEILLWTLDQVRRKGYKIMKLYTSTDPNEATAQVLYEKLGFKIIGEELQKGDTYKTLYRECAL